MYKENNKKHLSQLLYFDEISMNRQVQSHVGGLTGILQVFGHKYLPYLVSQNYNRM